MIFSLIGSVLGFIREILIAAKFGFGWETDVYFVAITGISLINLIIASSIRTILIPILSEVEVAKGKTGKIKETNNIINIGILISLTFIILGVIAAPLIIRILATGFEGEQFKLAVLLFRIGLSALIFKTVVGIYRGYLQSEERFFESAISDASLNIVVILFLLTLSARYGIIGLTVFTTASELSQIIVQVPGLKKSGYFFEIYINLKSKYLSKFLKLVPPILISTAIDDVQKIIDKTIASNLVEGSISALNYAEKIERTVISVFITSLVTVLFPTISRKASGKNYDELIRVSSTGLNSILLITLPASLGLITFSYPIVELVYQRGQFGVTATEMTSTALVFYSIGLVPITLRMFYNNIYFAIHDTKTPMINGAISVGMKIIFSFILVQYMEHAGLALATSLSAIIMTILLITGLTKRVGHLITRDNIIVAAKALFASLLSVAVAYLLYKLSIRKIPDGNIFNFILLTVVFTFSGSFYFSSIVLLKVEEVTTLLSSIKRRYFR